MNQAAHFTPILDRGRTFTVAENSRGQWVARERQGLIEGVFRTQRDAVRFALFESGAPDSVVVIAEGRDPGPVIH